MSITCPKCGTEIDQDFGLVNCPGCSTVLAVDVDGHVQIPAEHPIEQSAESPSAFEEIVVTPEELPVPEAQEAQTPESALEEPISETPEAGFVQNTDFNSESFDENEPSSEASGPAAALEDIKNFGNKDSSSGPLTYSLKIDGMDAGSIRKAVVDALDEPQFGWTGKEISRSIQGGHLILEPLSAAQAVMVVRLLRGIKVQLSWKQHLYK